jgi:ketosteroid isomerase-like protein
MSIQVETMNAQEIANRLVELCREGKNSEAINELYDEHAISLEPEGSQMPRTEGRDAILRANEQWFESVQELHSAYVSDPLVGGDYFACSMNFDVTYKEQGRMDMNELAVYGVKDGKIASSQFFYNM